MPLRQLEILERFVYPEDMETFLRQAAKKKGVLERHFEIGHGDMKVTWCTPQVQDDSQGQHLDSY